MNLLKANSPDVSGEDPRQSRDYQLTAQSAFTLIELLVTITISTVMVGLGIAAYNNFNESQTLELATRKLKGDLWATQTKAVANKQPPPPQICTDFEGYRVVLKDSGYTLDGYCAGEILYFDSSSLDLPAGVSKESPVGDQTFWFKPRTGGVDFTDADLNPDGSLEITFQFTSGATQTITITPTGEIR